MADAVDDGLIQRLIPVHLEPAEVGEDQAEDNVAYKNYGALVERLTKLPGIGGTPGDNPFDFNTADNHRHAILDAEAQEIRRAFEHYTNQLTRLEAISPQFAAFAGKFDGIFARLALTFHCCESIDLRLTQEATKIPERITEDTAKRVVRLMREFIIPHALHFYLDVAGETTILADSRSIAGYLLAKRVERITFGDLTTNCRPCRKKTRDKVIQMIEPLEMFGWLQREGPPLLPKAWLVDPRVHEIFAERAEEERERRQLVRSLFLQSTEEISE